jgi:hypothetical protein
VVNRLRQILSGGSPRRPSLITDLAVSVADLAQTRFAAGRGGTVFLAGGPGAGQGLVFEQLPQLLAQHREQPLLLRGTLTNGAYIAGGMHSDSRPGAVSTTIELMTSLAAFSGPLGALLGQIAGSMSNSQRLLKELSRERPAMPAGPRVLQRALRALADQQPVCFAVQSTAPVGGLWWLNLIEGLAAEADVDLRLLLILGIEAPSCLPPPKRYRASAVAHGAFACEQRARRVAIDADPR